MPGQDAIAEGEAEGFDLAGARLARGGVHQVPDDLTRQQRVAEGSFEPKRDGQIPRIVPIATLCEPASADSDGSASPGFQRPAEMPSIKRARTCS